MTRKQAQAVTLSDRSQNQLSLHHCKVATYTHAWATRKGEVGIVWARGYVLRQKTLRVKALGIGPVIGMMLRRIRTHQDQTIGWNWISSQFIIRDRLAAEDTERWIESHRFLNHHTGILQLGKMLHRGQLTSQHLVDFGKEALLYLWMLREQVPGPRQSIGCRLMPCQQ